MSGTGVGRGGERTRPLGAASAPRLRHARALSVLVSALVIMGCGRKGPPVLPERRVPLPAAELSATVGPGEVTLSWTNPNRRVDNSRMRDLATVQLYRVADAGTGEPKPAILSGEKVVGYTRLALIRLDRPEPAVIDGNQARFVDRANLRDGERYTYVVTAADSMGRTSAPSRRLSVVYIAAPEPPANLAGKAGERQVALAWDPPRGLSDGRPLAGSISYQVLRASSPDARPAPVTPAPIAGAPYTDTNLENEQTYYYSVRAVRSDAGGVAVSEASRVVAVTPRKMTPPSPPTGLLAIAAVTAVRLTWDASPDPDVAGYVIYRARPGGEMARIGTAKTPKTVFVDVDVALGTYRYAVSAFDTATIPNESARSAEASVSVP